MDIKWSDNLFVGFFFHSPLKDRHCVMINCTMAKCCDYSDDLYGYILFMNEVKTINLLDLGTGEIPALSKACGLAFAESAGVCFEEQGHLHTVEIKVEGDYDASFNLNLPDVTDQMRSCYADREVTTENGAYGVAIMLVINLTEFTAIGRSAKATAIDYWLGKKDDDYPFLEQARLEVSGIRKGNDSNIDNRLKQKIDRLNKVNSKLPAYIIIVEFSKPRSKITSFKVSSS
ncbi:MAG: hypothetical protein L7F77_13200 [Candidatus Magnetominusculus sp. LBB02]|nr:hypothetical protein [Candidatus Magnetominusculus sp. LBB02]